MAKGKGVAGLQPAEVSLTALFGCSGCNHLLDLTAVVPEPVVQEAKPLTKLEQYKLRLEEKEKEKAAKAEAKRKAKEEKEAAKRKAKEEVEKVKAEKKRLEEEAKARKEHNKQTVKEQNDLYTSHSSDQNTSPKNDLIKTIQVVKR